MTGRAAQQMEFLYTRELIVDNFAGGGGASLGIEWAFGRAVDIAINHDAEAIAMHRANHPETRHYCEDVFRVDPVEACGGRPVGLAWFSPDCTHFSKAKGGRPRSKKSRALAWVVIRWARRVRPRIIMLENVEEFAEWGPMTPDGRPCPLRKGQTFTHWVQQLRRLGYRVEWRELLACEYGAPTIRKRLFLVARCDGRPIVWPKATHGKHLLPYRTAAECIEWSIPCPSIFERRRPLAEATLRRIAKGIQRYVIEAAEPFIVTCNHAGDAFRGQGVGQPVQDRDGGARRERPTQEPRTHSLQQPLPTVVTTANGAQLVAAFLAKHYGGNYDGAGIGLASPMSTVTTHDHHALVASHLVKLRGTCRDGQDLRQPMATITAGGTHIGEVRAFLIKYYSCGGDQDGREPLHTITTRNRFGLVTVQGEDYQIVDIGMRMLEPRELFRAQGFPDDYVIDPVVQGRPLSKTAQVRMCGNSVSPRVAKALIEANAGVIRETVAA